MPWKIVTFVADKLLKAADVNVISDNFTALAQHRHTGASGDGSTSLSGTSARCATGHTQVFPRYPTDSSGATYPTSANYRIATAAQLNAQNDYITFRVALIAGNYRVNVLLGSKGSNHGIGTLYFDGVSIGTVDAYNASTVYNQLSVVTGVTVAASGQKDFKISNVSKNASSSAYVWNFQCVEFLKV